MIDGSADLGSSLNPNNRLMTDNLFATSAISPNLVSVFALSCFL